MDPVAEIALWTGLFVSMHFLLSSGPVRARLVGRVGVQPFCGIYSLVALGTFIPMVVVFGHNKHAGAMLWNLRDEPAARGLSWLLIMRTSMRTRGCKSLLPMNSKSAASEESCCLTYSAIRPAAPILPRLAPAEPPHRRHRLKHQRCLC
jgi:NnrU protein